jgi:heat shock protein HslJ
MCARFSSVPLEKTYWKLTRLGGKPVSVAAKQREPHFVLDNKTKRIAASGLQPVHRYLSTERRPAYIRENGPDVMACPEEMETERDFVGALEQVRSWKILGDHFELFDSGGNLLARLEARALK